jgi:hypothetical protein
MTRLALISITALLSSGCLDDDLDDDTHFLREARDLTTEAPTAVNDNQDAGADFNPGQSIKLGELSSFIALVRDFEGFQSWPSWDLGTGAHAVEQQAPTHVYINALPQSGDSEFRVGTLIVKVLEMGDEPSTWQVHGMAKRGAGYNAKGAYGWEYFDFTLDADGIPHENWRGANVPNGESYQTTVFTSDGQAIQQDVPDCNTCHQTSNNDAVNTGALELGRWQ